jgi:hypothetical protein
VAEHKGATDGKRRLPMLKSGAAEEDTPPRPRWQWVVFGALAIVTVWVPATAIAGAFATRLAIRAGEHPVDAGVRIEVATVSAYALALAVGATAGGYMMGRWGAAVSGVREAALAGLVASVVAAGASWSALGPTPGALAVVVLTVPVAALGGMLGLRQRARAG